ncbi:MAG TPA: ABC transporter permease [Candidatus Angelobacter sp.]|nr:ABC transporter permease [Candidatus Angelobacter sp.]
MNGLLQDVRYGWRMLMKSRVFAISGALTLAVGIGATTLMFAVIDSVLLRSLPYPNAERVLWISETAKDQGVISASIPNFRDWQEQNHSFAAMAARQWQTFVMSGDGLPQQLEGVNVTHEYFGVLGVAPILGRNFRTEDDQPGAALTVIISNGFWHRQFASNPDIIGRAITLSQKRYTIIGVLPPQWSNAEQVSAVYVPLGLQAHEPFFSRRIARAGIYVVGLLKPGVTRTQAQADLGNIAARLQQQYPDSNRDNGVELVPLRDRLIVGQSRPALLLLMAAVACLLLIACGNVANLLLARAAVRTKEIAIRAALGASRTRLLRQLLTESLLLAMGGGAAGLLLALWGKHMVSASLANAVSPLARVEIDVRVLAFAVAVSVVTGIVFGIAPALHASSSSFSRDLQQPGRTSHASGAQRLRDSLVVAELAMSLALLAGAGLLVRSFVRVLNVSPGFNPRNVLTAIMVMPNERYNDVAKAEAFFDEAMRQIRAVPGVTSASAVTPLPLSFNEYDTDYQLEGDTPGTSRNTEVGYLATDYARTMKIPMLEGREFTAADNAKAPPVAMVNDTFAHTIWPGRDPIGQKIRLDIPSNPNDMFLAHTPWRTVVGVIATVRQYGQDARAVPAVYMPMAQPSVPIPMTRRDLVIRTSVEPESLVSDIRHAVALADVDQAISNVQTMQDYLADSLAARRLTMALLGVFAALATLLAGIGIYGVLSYWVEQRTREIGIRVALGAQRRQVLSLILRHAGGLVALSIVVGLGISLALGRWLRAMLFDISSLDAIVFCGVTLLIAALALFASYFPALRATRIDPIIALRAE